MNIHTIPQIKHSNSGNFFLLAGPCAIEGEEMAMRIAEKLVGITDKLEIPFVFKGSSKKQIALELIVFQVLVMKKHYKYYAKYPKLLAFQPLPIFIPMKMPTKQLNMLMYCKSQLF